MAKKNTQIYLYYNYAVVTKQKIYKLMQLNLQNMAVNQSVTIVDICMWEEEYLDEEKELFGNIEKDHEDLVRKILSRYSDETVVDLGIGPTVSQIVNKANLVGRLIGVDKSDFRQTTGYRGLYSAEALIPNFEFIQCPFESYQPEANSFHAALMFGVYADYRLDIPEEEPMLYPGMSTGTKEALDNLFVKVVNGLKPAGELLITNPFFEYDDYHNPERAIPHMEEFFSTVYLLAKGERRYLLLCKDPKKSTLL